MDRHIAANKLRTTQIQNIKTESPTVKIFTIKDKQCAMAKPGQFLMLWIPGVDEIPLSILEVQGASVTVAVKNVGEATKALHAMRIGDFVGIRGPLGNSFTMSEGKVLMVGGGTGMVPLLFLARMLKSKVRKLVFVTGAKTKSELLFKEMLEKLCEKRNVVATTEDGSYGLECLATTPLESLLDKDRFDMIYTCGPERMMRKVFDLAEMHGVPLEASLERLMRCAVGLCGSCVIGKYRVCRDGPVFTESQLREIKNEFGISKRGFDGKRIPLE